MHIYDKRDSIYRQNKQNYFISDTLEFRLSNKYFYVKLYLYAAEGLVVLLVLHISHKQLDKIHHEQDINHILQSLKTHHVSHDLLDIVN